MTQSTDTPTTSGHEADLDADLTQSLNADDSLDDASRRALLGRIARVGAASAPVALVLLNAQKARANTGSTPPFS